MYTLDLPPPDTTWCSAHLVVAIETATIDPSALHNVMLHHLLSLQSHPPGYGGGIRPYSRASTDVTSHLQRECPPCFLHTLALSWRILCHCVMCALLQSPHDRPLFHGGVVVTPHLHVCLTMGLPGTTGVPLALPHARQQELGKWLVQTPVTPHLSRPSAQLSRGTSTPLCPPPPPGSIASIGQCAHHLATCPRSPPMLRAHRRSK